MKIRYIVMATVAYFASMIVAGTIVSAIARNRPLNDAGLDPVSWGVVIFYGVTWWFVPIIAAVMIRNIRIERMMGLRP